MPQAWQLGFVICKQTAPVARRVYAVWLTRGSDMVCKQTAPVARRAVEVARPYSTGFLLSSTIWHCAKARCHACGAPGSSRPTGLVVIFTFINHITYMQGSTAMPGASPSPRFCGGTLLHFFFPQKTERLRLLAASALLIFCFLYFATLSQNLSIIAATWARVALPCASRTMLPSLSVVPLMRPTPTAHASASFA